MFICYVTGFVHVGLMTDQSGEATLECKYDFEHMCATRGVKVKAHHADNGIFAERSFINDVKCCFQRITFCGVGAHHQNGVSEKAIKQLILTACTLIVHAQRHWPEHCRNVSGTIILSMHQERA